MLSNFLECFIRILNKNYSACSGVFELNKPNKKICPKCKSTNVIDIIYGYPDDELMGYSHRKEVELGGCCVEDNQPDFHCKTCGNQW